MRVISTNIANPRTILWQGRQVTTGIFKEPTSKPIQLELENVKGDEVSDRRVHGGIFKACYLFSADDYPYWKEQYPHLEWIWGMFGENITLEHLDESTICIGDTYQLGSAIVQITQPREPCFKLGVKFGTHKIIKHFVNHRRSGTYVRVLKKGTVAKDDVMTLIKRKEEHITISQFLDLLYSKEKDQALLDIAIRSDALPERKRNQLEKFVT